MGYQGRELPFADPHLALNINILKCRSTSMASLWERVWGSPEFYVQLCCEEAEGPTEFYTKPFKRHKEVQINETFTFGLPYSYAKTNTGQHGYLPLKVTLFKGAQTFGYDYINSHLFELNKIYERKIKFENGSNIIKMDIEIEKIPITQPDFRYSLNLCQEELEALTKRKTHIFKHMQKTLPNKKGKPKNIHEIFELTYDELTIPPPLLLRTLDQCVDSTTTVPIVSIACSGGGYRSTIQFCGVMEALTESGVLDMISYMSGLSGGAWYVLPAYVKKVLTNVEELKDFHSRIKLSVKSSLIVDTIVDVRQFMKYLKYARTKKSEGQTVTFVDFYGFVLGKSFLGQENMSTTLRDLQPYAGSGEVPLPIVTALHIRPRVSSASFNADLEITPWEISMPQYGINLPADKFGSEWYKGKMMRQCPEPPIHFFLGTSSSAFGILLKYYLGGETTETDETFLSDIRSHEFGRHNTKRFRRSFHEKILARRRQSRFSSISSSDKEIPSWQQIQRKRSVSRTRPSSGEDSWHDARLLSDSSRKSELTVPRLEMNNRKSDTRSISNTSDYDTVNEDDIFYFPSRKMSRRKSSKLFQGEMFLPLPEPAASVKRRETVPEVVGIPLNETTEPKQEAYLKKILEKISHHPLFTDREAVVDRTAKVFNFARGFSNIRYFPLNPKHEISRKDADALRITNEEDTITFVDAAVISNTPTNCLLRSQRKSDVLIVCDATEYKSDTDIDYLELFIAEKSARQQGLKFPKIDPARLKANPRGIIHVFEEKDDPSCPIVIWFTLCNKEYKALNNVQPPPKRWLDESYKVPPDQKFNVFPVYGPQSCYSTLNTRYSPLEFDRLKELMKYNISSNIEVIKRQIMKKVLQKRQFSPIKETQL